MSNYERDTRSAYRSLERAADYHRYHTAGWSWGRIATWFEQRAVRRLVGGRSWAAGKRLLDVPCGTGILATALEGASSRVLASDIAGEMMAIAAHSYRDLPLDGFVRADITALPFGGRAFDGVVTLGFMHRVPAEIRRGALAELRRVASDGAIVSFSLDSAAQRVKHGLLRVALRRAHKPAPHRAAKQEIEAEIRAAGFRIASSAPVLPLLSTEWLYLLTPSDNAR